MESERISILDKGYVILQDKMGSDLTAVNSARVSFKKKSNELNEKDERLLQFLAESKPPHLSPWRHAVVQYEICAPVMVARQMWKYIVGAANGESQDSLLGWNEASYRYVSNDIEFYVPDPTQWRGAPDNKKQGSLGTLDEITGKLATQKLEKFYEDSLNLYEWAMDKKIAPEQARLFLPANGQYTIWYLTTSVAGLVHLLIERLDEHAMYETQCVANAMLDLALPWFPRAFSLLLPPELF